MRFNTARLHIAGIEFPHRDSAGDLILLSYHPRGSATWHWSICLSRREAGKVLIDRATQRTGQWHDFYRLPFGLSLIVSRQDWHKARGRS